MRQIILLYLTFIFPVLCNAQDYVLTNETTVLEFKTKNGKQLVIAIDTNNQYLIYRYGTSSIVELQFPQDKTSSWSDFQYSWYLRGGGIHNEGLDLNYLYFNNGDYKYVIFQEYTSVTEQTEFGIKIINLLTEKVTIFKAVPNTVKGTLSFFRDNNYIKEGDELFY